jgi:anthranilate synthase component 2
MPNVTLIDNYDSFTWNLVHYFGALGASVTVRRNDQIGVDAVLATGPTPSCCRPAPARRARQAFVSI